ncbi:MAG: hypothetical protein V8T10_09070 [Merdibacter sp.]
MKKAEKHALFLELFLHAKLLLSALPVHAANMVTTTDGHGESETVGEKCTLHQMKAYDWGIVKANGSVQVGSQTVDLLVTFQSPEAAMANFKNKYGGMN